MVDKIARLERLRAFVEGHPSFGKDQAAVVDLWIAEAMAKSSQVYRG